MQRLKEAFTSDIPFARDDARRLMPAMIACMAGFAALLLALAMTFTGALDSQSKDVSGVVEVTVPASRGDDKPLMQQILAAVQTTPGVEQVTVLRHDDMEALLKPWLGSNFSLGDLPVPVLLDVKTRVHGNETVVDLTALSLKLKKLDPNVHVEDRGPWVSHMEKAMTLLQGLVILIAALLLACLLGMIVLVAKTNLKLHFKTVSLLHMFGATDEYILRQFQWEGAMLAARGALFGVLFAVLVFGTAIFLSHRWASPVMPPIDFSLLDASVFIFLPVFVALTSLLATRLTVQSMLHHMH